MNREELKNKLKLNFIDEIKVRFDCSEIKVRFDCSEISCDECLFNAEHGCTKEDYKEKKAIEEVWVEVHGYIKKKETDIEKIAIDPSKIGPTITVKDTSDKQLNPDHYKAGKLQTIEQMMIVFGPNKVAGFCEVNAFKYHARAGLKGDASLDHKKADWYMRLYDRLKVFGCMDGEKALEALREFLKEEEEK